MSARDKVPSFKKNIREFLHFPWKQDQHNALGITIALTLPCQDYGIFLLCCPYQKDMYCPVHDDSHESNIVLDYVISPFESEVTSFSLYWGELYLYSFILSQYNM